MYTYYIDFIDKRGDLYHIWVEADNKEEAIQQAKSEYWDIAEIIQVRRG